MIEMKFSWDMPKTVGEFRLIRRLLPRAMEKGMTAGLLGLIRYMVKTKLTHSNPPYLNRRTGTLIRSFTESPKVESTEESVRGTFGSHLDYAKKHELGFVGYEQVPEHRVGAHWVRSYYRQTGGWSQSVKVSRHIRAQHTVRAHRRAMEYRARHYMRDSAVEMTPTIRNMMRASLAIMTQTRKVPSISAINQMARAL